MPPRRALVSGNGSVVEQGWKSAGRRRSRRSPARGDSAEPRERFAAAGVAPLATADAAGRPHLVPVVFAIDGDLVYTVGRRQAQADDPRCGACATWPRTRGWRCSSTTTTDTGSRLVVGACQRRYRFDPTRRARRAVELLQARSMPQQRAVGAALAVDVDRWSRWPPRSPARAVSPRLLICARIVVS